MVYGTVSGLKLISYVDMRQQEITEVPVSAWGISSVTPGVRSIPTLQVGPTTSFRLATADVL